MDRSPSRWVLALLCATLGLGVAAPAASAGALKRVGRAPALPVGTSLLGLLATDTPMRVTVALAPRAPAALQRFATAVSTPGSASYRHFITPAQFARRFGATRAQAAAVEASLRAHGLTPGRLSANGLSIPVSATAGKLERAFSLSLVRLRLAHGATAVFNDLAPALDARIAGSVQAVVGLTSAPALRPLSAKARRPTARLLAHAQPHVVTGGPQPCSAAVATAPGQSAYTADQIASAYGLGGLYRAGDEGQGVTIALYELEPNDPGDIASYASCYGVSPQVSYVQVDGGVDSGPGSGEAALDLEQVIGLAPKASFLVYQGPNSDSSAPGSGPYDLFGRAISDDRAEVISVSWGQCEKLVGAADASAEGVLFQEAAAQGQTIVAASGDSGSEDCDTGGTLPDLSSAVDDPGSQPFVTSVGGTSMGAPGPPPSETVWNNGGSLGGLLGLEPGAGGGGPSAVWPMPSYQAGAPASLRVVQNGGSTCHQSGPCREVPDISADADPNTGYLIFYNGSGSASGPSGWSGTGGTSASAPVWAAVVALADASKTCSGAPIGFLNPALYRAAASGYGSYFHDIVAGNNDFTATNQGRYAAGPGYDMATGLGSPNGSALAAGLCAAALRVPVPGTHRSTLHAVVDVRLRASDARDVAPHFRASGLPPGLGIDGSTGRVTGRPVRAGTFPVGLTVTDAAGNVRSVFFRWVIGGPPKLSGASLAQVGVAQPLLSFGVAVGRNAPPVAKLVVGLPAGLQFASRPRHVTVTGPGGKRLDFSTGVARGALTVKLRTAAPTVHVTVGYASITASSGLVTAFQLRRVGRLSLGVAASDTGGGTTKLSARLRLRS